MIGYRNRILVSAQWLLSYMTHERGGRIIVGSTEQGSFPPRKPVRAQPKVAAGLSGQHVGQPLSTVPLSRTGLPGGGDKGNEVT